MSPLLDELVDRRLLRRRDLRIGNPVRSGGRDDLRIKRILDDVPLRHHQLVLRCLSRLLDGICVVKHQTDITDASHARVEARRRLAALKARIAQDALLGLAGRPVEIGLLVGATRNAHAPRTASLLTDQHHAILAALVDRALRARRNAARIQAMIADTRQVEEDGTVDLVDLAHFLVGSAIEVRIIVRVNLRPAQIVVPVRTRFNGVHVLAGHHRDGACGGLAIAQRRVDQVLIVIGPWLEIVVERRQVGVVKDVAQRSPLALKTQPQTLLPLAVDHPAAAIFVLVFPTCRVSRTRLGLHVVPVHVLGALAIRPDVLAREAAGVTADALIQVKDHRNLRSDIHV